MLIIFFLSSCAPRYASFSEAFDLYGQEDDRAWLEPRSRDHEELWNEHRTKIRREIESNPRAPLFLFGDSITQGWRRHEDLLHACLGYTADQTKSYIINGGVWADGLQHMLWRLRVGDFEHLEPRVIVFLGGTNNGGQTSRQMAVGIQTVVEELIQRFPNAHVLLLGIFPIDQYPTPRRMKRAHANKILAGFPWDKKRVTFLDISPVFLGGTSELSKDVFPDYLHLSRLGYGIWAVAMCTELQKNLGRSFW